MKITKCSTDFKIALRQIKQHIFNNTEVQKGKRLADELLKIPAEIFAIKCGSLSYNERCEFRLLCDQHSSTQLFVVDLHTEDIKI